MFEPISYNLSQLAYFAVLGFFLGMSYEPLRIVRLFKRQGVILVAVQDFLFLTQAGVITFAYSMELGSGQFRLFFIAGEIFGAAVYFLTVGKVVSMLSELIVKFVKAIISAFRRFIVRPFLNFIYKISKFLRSNLLKINNFISKLIKNSLKHLKNTAKMRYNGNVHKQYVKNPKGDIKNVIKAKVTKKA